MISKASLQNQCDYGEACLRIFNLLNFLDRVDEFPVTKKYYGAIDHLAVFQARQDLSSQAAFQEDVERFKAEAKFKEDFAQELREIINTFQTTAQNSR